MSTDQHDHNGVNRRKVLECMTWAGTGVLWTVAGGVPTAVGLIDDAMAQIKAAEEKTKQAANEARKASAKASFYLFFSMLIGAFIASAAGALGGRQRDEI